MTKRELPDSRVSATSFRLWVLGMGLILFATVGALAGTSWGERTRFTNSITPMPPKVAATVRGLRREHLGKTMEFEIPLRMRGYPKLLEKIGRGEVLSPAEMERDYLPLAADYKALTKWLRSQGFTITQTDPSRLTIFAHGTLAQIQQALEVELVEVTAEGIDYDAARTHPSLPKEIAQPVLGINGLQPYLQLHKHSLNPSPNIADKPPYVVKEILGAYDAQNLGVTGSNQKIAILIDTAPANSDLTAFWSFNNIPQTLSNIEVINVTGGALPAPSGEETLDVEWSSGIAPKAKVRLYASGSLSFTNLDKSLQRIISDLPSQPQMHQLSISLGLGETYLLSSSQMQTDAQFFATIASRGVSVFVSSGDAGSNPDNSGQSSTGPLQVEYFASDPSVTGVGGTNLTLNSTTGQVTNESGWSGSGGGVSQYFSRPTWQTGNGVLAGTKRLVPDLALVASDTTDAYFYFKGKGSGVAGTSWSAPTWAGFCALLNEARANASQGPLGLLNPRIYPLVGTSNFRDIASGSNGHYSAGSGYDMVTGLGVPSVATLLQTLAGMSSSALSVSSFNPTSGAVNTTVTISGANLGRVTAVAFNGVAASFTVDSSTQITTTVPTGAATGVIAVTATPGGTATASSNFTVLTGGVGNDNFASAQAISLTSGTLTASNVGATEESGEPNHAGNAGGASVWYAWTAPKAGTYTFDTFGSSFDTLLGIYTGGSVTGLTPVAANDDAGTGVTSSVSFVASANTLYRVAVDGHDGQSGTVILHWLLNSAAPVINSFTPATGAPGTVVAINGAGFTGVTSVKFNGTSALFSLVSSTQITATVPNKASTGILSLTTPNGTATSAAVFTALNPPANDNFANALAITGSSGALTGGNSAATKELGEPNHAGYPGGVSVWYSWTAPSSSTYSFNTFGSSFDTLLAVYTGSSVDNLTQVAANDDTGAGVASSITFSAAAGTVYSIAVDGNGAASGNISLAWNSDISPPTLDSLSPPSGPSGAPVVILGSHFTGASSVSFNGISANFVVNSDTQITATVPSGATSGFITIANLNGTGASANSFLVTSGPVNDNFANRIAFSGSGGTVMGSNPGATKETGEPTHAGNSGGRSVWWTWTAPATGQYIISTLGSSFDTLLGVYTGNSVSALTTVASNDDDVSGGVVTSSLTLNATAGATYQIAVDGLNGASGNIILTIAPNSGTSTLFSTAFEAAEGYSTSSPLGGQPASAPASGQWQLQGLNGNGVLDGFFAGQGQQAYIGYTGTSTKDTFLWKPINYTPSAGDTVTFSVLMDIVDSTKATKFQRDDFQWQVYNSSGQTLFAIDFDNASLAIGYFLNDGTYHSAGASFANSTKYALKATLDFGRGTWGFSLNGKILAANQPLINTTPAATLDFGDVDAVWGPADSNLTLGDNYLLFDNYSITKTGLLAPQIVLQPRSQSVNAGDSVVLSVAALGSPPLTYRWQKNGTNIKGATGASLNLSNVQAVDAATYTVMVGNSANTVPSDPAKLIVNTPPPSYTVSTTASPSNEGTTSGGGTYQSGTSVTVTATANSGDSFVSWTENGSVVSTSPSYVFAIAASRILVANFQVIHYSISASSLPVASGTTSGGGSYPNATSATVTAAPASGYQFVNWTESGTGVSTAASYTFNVTGNRVLVANFIPDTTPPVIAIAAPTSNPIFKTTTASLNLSGTASDNVAVTAVTWANDRGGNGSAVGTKPWSATGIPLLTGSNLLTATAIDAAGNSSSATLTVIYTPPVNFSLFSGNYTGLLETSGTAEAFNGLARVRLTTKGTFTATIWFQNIVSTLHGKFALDGTFSGTILRTNHASLAVSLLADANNANVLSGSVTDGAILDGFLADRSLFNSKTNPCPYVGRYTVVMKGDPSDANSPQGQGIGTLTVSSGGSIRFRGVLADGSSVSQGVNISKDGLWPLFARPYGHTGFIAGPQYFANPGDINGVIDWFKPIKLTDGYFPNGIQTRLTLIGEPFKVALSGSTVIQLGPRSLKLQDDTVQLDKTVTLNPPGSFSILDPGVDRLVLKISVNTGLVSGKFLANPLTGVWTNIRAVMLQNQDSASGFFLEGNQSGDVELAPAP